MHKLTVLTLLSLSLTMACMSEASWPHRDRAGFPMSTWQYRAWERDNACRGVQRAAEVSPDSLSDRQRLLATRCGYGELHYWQHGRYTTPPPQTPPSYPTRPETARSAGADPVAQGVSGR